MVPDAQIVDVKAEVFYDAHKMVSRNLFNCAIFEMCLAREI